MDNPAMETCCACLVTTPKSTMHSLADRNTLQLFQDCTNISVPDDNQLICALCYKQCDMWECFKTRCQQSYKLKKSEPIIPDTDPEEDPHPPSLAVKEEPTQFELIRYHVTSTIKPEPQEDGDDSVKEWAHPSSSQPPIEEIILPSYSKVVYQEPAPHPEGRDHIPQQSRVVYVQSYLNYMRWKEQRTTTTSTENNEDSLLAYFKHQNSLISPSSLGTRFAHLKATMLAFQNIDLEHYGVLRHYVRSVRSDYQRKNGPKLFTHQLMQFFNVQIDLNVTKRVIVTLWIAGIRQNDLFRLLIEDVRDKGDHIEVKGLSQIYIIKPFAHYKYDPLPQVRKYLDLVRRNGKDKPFIQKVVGNKIIPEKLGLRFIRQLPKQVAIKLNLPHPEKFILKSLPQPRRVD